LRFASLGGFGAALACAAFLVACGGGGGSAPTSGSLTGGSMNGNHAASNQGPGTHVTVVIYRGGDTKTHGRSNTRRGAKSSTRKPEYLSTEGQGLQISVSATGVASQTIYADTRTSPLSPLCTVDGNNVETCVINVPTIAANEQITALQTDAFPANENSSGYGTGFGNGTNILGAIKATEAVTLGSSNNIALELGPAVGYFWDCTEGASYGNTPPPALPQLYSANYGVDTNPVSDPTTGARIVVTGGTAASGLISVEFGDIDSGWRDRDTTPAPFVDVNGSPTPITLTSSSSALTVSPIVFNGTPSTYAQTASIPDDSFEWYECEFFIALKTSASFSSASTLAISNNLTAINPFTSSAQPLTMTYTVVPLTVSSTSVTVAMGNSTTVTGTDPNASDPMDAESAYQTGDESCNTGGGTPLATISRGSLNTTNWTQVFTINAGGTTGTCTFYIYDTDAGTVTLPITVTIN
jgi:hypothetical protein